MKRLFLILIIALIIFSAFAWLTKQPAGTTSSIKWYAAFSKPFTEQLGLDWKETYLAILDDLKPQSIRTGIYWPDVEPQSGKFNWADYDWMVSEVAKRNVKLVLVIGRKLPRWPECHVPDWAKSESEQAQQNLILGYIKEAVNRYKNQSNLRYWQVENEPFLPYGECPIVDSVFLDKEIALVKSLDPNHQVLVTDSGELGTWFQAADRGDIFGTTIYRVIWKWPIGYFKYPLPPQFFWFKENVIHLFHPGKPIIVSELQAEPWGPKLIYEMSVEEQMQSMNLAQFSDNIEYAKAVGLPEVYLWGAEWWYWLKIKQGHPEFWDKAKQVISNQ